MSIIITLAMVLCPVMQNVQLSSNPLLLKALVIVTAIERRKWKIYSSNPFQYLLNTVVQQTELNASR